MKKLNTNCNIVKGIVLSLSCIVVLALWILSEGAVGCIFNFLGSMVFGAYVYTLLMALFTEKF